MVTAGLVARWRRQGVRSSVKLPPKKRGRFPSVGSPHACLSPGKVNAILLTESDYAYFDHNGYLVVQDVLPETLCADVVADCEAIADKLSRRSFYEGGAPEYLLTVTGTQKLIALTSITKRSYSQHFDISLPTNVKAIRSDTPLNMSAAVFSIITNEHLLDLVEDLVGPEIVCNPTQHLRIKLPNEALPEEPDAMIAAVPWHQDNGVLLDEADESNILTVWLPMTAATKDSGCLEVRPAPQGGPLLPHCPRPNGHSIPDHLMSALGEPVPLEMVPGAALLMHRRTVHASRRKSNH